ncbi:MAG TPA: M20/M25/M40 family metallo-hydrolase [Fimbriimonadaceae bacterium]|jgi:acetylornithine deacetylase
MNVIELTRALVDIPSVTENEAAIGEFLCSYLAPLLARFGGRLERMPVAGERFNVLAVWGDSPTVTFSTHLDTVPPFFPSEEDEEFVTGRGSCDAKGILASMVTAVSELLEEGVTGIGILAVVGEERGSAGALAAGKVDRGARFLINGEPTENKLAIGSKGALRLDVSSWGVMAHSAYPELGDSAIDKLLAALERIKAVPLPVDPVLGPSTLNIGTLAGGRAPNVIADSAKAELLVRLVDNGTSIVGAYTEAVGDLAEVKETLRIPAKHLRKLSGFETTTVAYTTDIPLFGDNWGEPFLLGPGTIHVAHTDHERVPKSELLRAVELYKIVAKALLTGGGLS